MQQARRILALREALHTVSDEELLRRSRELQWMARSGRALAGLVESAFALVCESSRRNVQMIPYAVQVVGGVALFEGQIAEMQTGEGKTLTATLPSYLYALKGRGCHVLTTNDYLASRDSEFAGGIFRPLGLSTGCIQSEQEPEERRAAYHCDVTYGTAAQVGFDFLRDRLRTGTNSDTSPSRWRYSREGTSSEGTVQREQYFALIDEADSILIDEAITPLIIGLAEPNGLSSMSLLHWCDRAARRLEADVDYLPEPERRQAPLTEAGSRRVLLTAKPRWLDRLSYERILTQVETALAARLWYECDREYVVHNGEITIVDESTGRMMLGRKWQQGLHQAMEVKEGVPVTDETLHAAQITIQTLFRRYRHLAGMTGTAVPARRELKRVYRAKVSSIPTHRKCLRAGLPPRVFGSHEARNRAIVREILQLVDHGRAVLVGTPSVSESELLSRQLSAAEIPHQVLNALQHEREAEIVAKAGQPGRVTIATNMAGRGTDIIPHEDVRQRGGLHVIATAVHSSARIDRQLVGRTARQGDPGSFQFFLSLGDELLRQLPPRGQLRATETAASRPDQEVGGEWYRVFLQAQRILEKRQLKHRKELLQQEERQHDAFRRMGLDPFLECAEQ